MLPLIVLFIFVEVSAPANAVRLDTKTPCKIIGTCRDCHSDERMCCSYVTLGQQRIKGRIKVIIVGESNLLSGFHPLGGSSNIQDLEDFIISNNLLPLGSLVYLLFDPSKVSSCF